VGVTATGKILLVVVDGRQPRWSLGPTSSEFAQIMADLGAVTALNLDGGGSSEMVVEGEVVNRPSDGHERAITNAILVLPGPDPDEP
jgi:exopolysaccharide biosynthesis protein